MVSGKKTAKKRLALSFSGSPFHGRIRTSLSWLGEWDQSILYMVPTMFKLEFKVETPHESYPLLKLDRCLTNLKRQENNVPDCVGVEPHFFLDPPEPLSLEQLQQQGMNPHEGETTMTPTFSIAGHITEIETPTDPNNTTEIRLVAISTHVPKKQMRNGIFTVAFTDEQIEDVLTFAVDGHLTVTGDIIQYDNENGTVMTYYFVTNYQYCPF